MLLIWPLSGPLSSDLAGAGFACFTLSIVAVSSFESGEIKPQLSGTFRLKPSPGLLYMYEPLLCWIEATESPGTLHPQRATATRTAPHNTLNTAALFISIHSTGHSTGAPTKRPCIQ